MPTKPKTSKNNTSATKDTDANRSSKPSSVPNWPPIQNLQPAEDLTLTTLFQDQIITIPRLWTSSLCKAYVNFLSTLPLTTTPGKPKRGEAVRVNDRFQVEDPVFAKNLWGSTALSSIVEEPILEGRVLNDQERKDLWGGDVLGLNSNIRIYRYSKGQFFDQHCKLFVLCLHLRDIVLIYILVQMTSRIMSCSHLLSRLQLCQREQRGRCCCT